MSSPFCAGIINMIILAIYLIVALVLVVYRPDDEKALWLAWGWPFVLGFLLVAVTFVALSTTLERVTTGAVKFGEWIRGAA